MYENSLSFAQQLDKEDPLQQFRDKFFIPQHNGQDVIYLCGNSLGLQPKSAKQAIEKEFAQWQGLAVEGHFKGENPWVAYHKQFKAPLSRILGALPDEVVAMNSLTVNLHLMLVSFYQPKGKRFKIITEKGAFPSDQYALESQVKFHGYEPEEAIIELQPRDGECTLRTEDIVQVIEDNKEQLALVMMSGLNYYTGQVFNIEAITKSAHQVGALAGFDLAHAAGNVSLQLHQWNVDFAVWCTYKYLNSSPGGVAGAFVHEKHATNAALPRFAGWWGHNEEERFLMKKGFKPINGADGWQLANAPILLMAVHKAAVDIFDEAGMEAIVGKSRKLTGFLEFLLLDDAAIKGIIQIITPQDPTQRGAQLSLLVKQEGKKLFSSLTEAGIVADWREPDVIRVAPAPLYNTFEEVYKFSQLLATHAEVWI
jgi:kynureninase